MKRRGEGGGEQDPEQAAEKWPGRRDRPIAALASRGGGDTSGRTNLEQPGLCSYIITPCPLCHF